MSVHRGKAIVKMVDDCTTRVSCIAAVRKKHLQCLVTAVLDVAEPAQGSWTVDAAAAWMNALAKVKQ